MINPNEAWNSTLFSTQDLEQLENIEKGPRTENEVFLCGLVERLFLQIAMLKDDLKQAETQLEMN